jgi:predicted methyltransferase MtxX (methanogen marker protein 4)
MSNFETMKALRWKIDQVHTKAPSKTFLQSLSKGEVEQNTKGAWTSDIILYVLFLGTVVAFVYIVMTFAKDFKP